MERPALARLLAAVAAGTVDAVIVYKVDLTRSLADFAWIVKIRRKRGARRRRLGVGIGAGSSRLPRPSTPRPRWAG
jgi:DNA invertase Pin-like site-specific DNA recombinase